MTAPPARCALITGAAGGIGEVSARLFAEAGYAVALVDREPASVEMLAEQLSIEGHRARAYVADISVAASVEGLFETLRGDYPRLDAAFNNAGVGALRVPLAELSEDDWQRCLDINLSGTWRCMKQEILWMRETGGGCIVNNASIFALNGGPSAAYTASKHGIAGLTRSAAVSYAAAGIRVNAICPGLIEAGMGLRAMARRADPGIDPVSQHPVGRPGRAEEAAQAALWLCSPQASFVHGHLLAVDGGYGAR